MSRHHARIKPALITVIMTFAACFFTSVCIELDALKLETKHQKISLRAAHERLNRAEKQLGDSTTTINQLCDGLTKLDGDFKKLETELTAFRKSVLAVRSQAVPAGWGWYVPTCNPNVWDYYYTQNGVTYKTQVNASR